MSVVQGRAAGVGIRPESLREVREAFAAGRERPGIVTEATSGSLYSEALGSARGSAHARRGLVPHSCWGAENEASVMARRGRLDESRRAFDRIQDRITSACLCPVGLMLVRALLEPAEALPALQTGRSRAVARTPPPRLGPRPLAGDGGGPGHA